MFRSELDLTTKAEPNYNCEQELIAKAEPKYNCELDLIEKAEPKYNCELELIAKAEFNYRLIVLFVNVEMNLVNQVSSPVSGVLCFKQSLCWLASSFDSCCWRKIYKSHLRTKVFILSKVLLSP